MKGGWNKFFKKFLYFPSPVDKCLVCWLGEYLARNSQNVFLEKNEYNLRRKNKNNLQWEEVTSMLGAQTIHKVILTIVKWISECWRNIKIFSTARQHITCFVNHINQTSYMGFTFKVTDKLHYYSIFVPLKQCLCSL